MGPLQTYFYLVLLGVIGAVLWLLLIGLALRYAVRGLRAGEQRLTFALIAGALVVALAFVALSAVGAVLAIVGWRGGAT
ncbi:MAG TPA: hypothetical protein VOB72_23245 [Candidatus Dormibacteraeota bacterium]|nr:hypothetical protein [Candidatus Dormibacteraeota bacterium]